MRVTSAFVAAGAFACAAQLSVAAAFAEAAPPPFERSEGREACAHHDALRRPFFGELHVHTAYSFDGYGQGTRGTPRDAYRFARGEAIAIQPYDEHGNALRSVKLPRPLDFAMVSDHAELLGETHICQTPGAPGHDSFVCFVNRRFPKLGYAIVNSQTYGDKSPRRYRFCGANGELCAAQASIVWQRIQDAAEEAYDRSAACRFTSFVGSEWTAMPGGNNLHRNIVYRNANVPPAPPNYIDDRSEEALWARLDADCIRAPIGCDALAIPHNSNVSGGLMFRDVASDGSALTREQAEQRARLERLVEISQHKGDSECRAGGSDELCGFEKLAFASMDEMAGIGPGRPIPANAYVREALVAGLALQQKLGVNPFALGIVAATDTHFATPGAVEEDRFFGHAAGTVTARLEVPAMPDRLDFNPGGLAALWAEENSRDALFAAMRRREAYGTSGPRMSVRFFGGWRFDTGMCQAPDFAARGYAGGVPMGGDLPAAPGEAAAPAFALWALKDAGTQQRAGTPLQRIQMIKGWVENGERREQVFDVAGDAKNGAGVDTATCELTGPGSDDLCAVWRDPGFDPTKAAVYYARVVENPSCRWNQYVCNARGVDCSDPSGIPEGFEPCCDASVPKTIQERAWTSPIWYTPQRSGVQEQAR